MSQHLKHYGVKGMKWVIRQTPPPDTLYSKRPSPDTLYSKHPSPDTKYHYIGDKKQDTSTVVSKVGSAKFYRLKPSTVNKGQLYTKSDLFKKKIYTKT